MTPFLFFGQCPDMLKQRHMAVDEIDELADADGREQRPDAHADDIAEKQPRQQCRDEDERHIEHDLDTAEAPSADFADGGDDAFTGTM